MMAILEHLSMMCMVTITNNSALTGHLVAITVNLTSKITNLFSDSIVSIASHGFCHTLEDSDDNLVSEGESMCA